MLIQEEIRLPLRQNKILRVLLFIRYFTIIRYVVLATTHEFTALFQEFKLQEVP